MFELSLSKPCDPNHRVLSLGLVLGELKAELGADMDMLMGGGKLKLSTRPSASDDHEGCWEWLVCN